MGRGVDVLLSFSASQTARPFLALVGARGFPAASFGGAEQPVSHPAFDRALAQAAATLDTPVELQKPKAEKALALVNFQTPQQRLIDQIAVPQDTNQEAAVAAHLPKMDLAGAIVIGDAAHTTKANCRLLTQEKGADYLSFLKGNQPNAHAKAKQLLHGDVSPSGPVDR